MIKCYDDNSYKPKLCRYTVKSEDEEDISEIFVEYSIKESYKKFKKKITLKQKDHEDYNNTTKCHICDGELKGDKVLNHDYLNGKLRGAAHNECNLNYKLPNHK